MVTTGLINLVAQLCLQVISSFCKKLIYKIDVKKLPNVAYIQKEMRNEKKSLRDMKARKKNI